MYTGFTLLCFVPSLLLDACTCDISRTLQPLYKDEFYSLLSSVMIEALGVGHTDSPSVCQGALEELKGISITSGFSFNYAKIDSH